MWTRLYAPVFSGLGLQIARRARALVARQVPVRVITARFPGLPRRETVDGVRIERAFTLRSRSDGLQEGSFVLAGTWSLLRARRDFAVLHVHAPSPLTFVPILVARLLGKRAVVQMSLLGSDDPVGRPGTRFRGLRSLSFRLAHGVVSISPPLSRVFLESGHDPRKLVQIPTTVDVERFHPADAQQKRRLRSELGLPREDPLLAFVGAVTERKGVDLLIEALAALDREGRGFQCVLVGPFGAGASRDDRAQSSFFAELRARIDSAGLAARVQLAGERDDVERFLRASDLFVFPSRREGFGTAIIEAMACGIPVVVAELDGIAESILDHDVHGLVVREPSAAAYAEAIGRILDDPRHACEMGEAARRRAEERYAMPVVLKAHLGLYERVLARLPAATRSGGP